MNITKNFVIEEFIDPATYERFGDKSTWFINPDIVNIFQAVRDRFGPITVNSWHVGGNRKYSGFRPVGSPYHSNYSQHSFGNAGDGILKNVTAEEVREDIRSNQEFWINLGLGGVENKVSWLHLDTRYNASGRIKFFNP